MVNSTSPKISKTAAIQFINKQIDDFLRLSDVIAEMHSPQVDTSEGEDINYYTSSVLPTFRQTVILISTLTSEDDALNFIEGVVSSSFNWKSRWHTRMASWLRNSIKDLITDNTTRFEHFFDKATLKYHWYNWFTFTSIYSLNAQVIRASVECLRLYRLRVIQTWDEETKHTLAFQVDQIGEFLMQGDSYKIGDITNSYLSGIVQGEHDTVVATLNAAGQPELAQALTTLTQAVLASQDLPADKKEEQIKVINQIGEEAAEPKPNKTLLKILVDGLLATLKTVPDVASAVTAVMPILSQLHL